jgi:ribosomal protein S18 acetylase RimI-like enzyme
MDLEIILATPADIERLLPHTETFWKFEKLPFELTRVRRVLLGLLESPAFGRVLIAQRGTEVIGYLVLTFGYSIEHGGRDALVDELYVRQSARSSGLGTRLLEEAFRICGREGISRVHLEVDNTNPRAEALYARVGFASNDRRLLTRRLA